MFVAEKPSERLDFLGTSRAMVGLYKFIFLH